MLPTLPSLPATSNEGIHSRKTLSGATVMESTDKAQVNFLDKLGFFRRIWSKAFSYLLFPPV